MASEYLDQSENAEVHWLAPPRYANFRTSGLEVNIKEPTEELVVALTWEGAEETDGKAKTEKSSAGDNAHEASKKQKSNEGS
jgi:hypothetical protein